MSAPDPAILKPIPGGIDAGCHTCAFRRGSETRSDTVTQVKGALCVLGGLPFYCHYDKAGVDFHETDEKPPANMLKICEGWKASVAEAAADPRWRKNREIRKAYAHLGLDALTMLAGNEDAASRKAELKNVERAINGLVLPERPSVERKAASE